MASLALGYWVHPAFFLFTAFVGANLFQSAFTNACPAMAVFRRLGLPDAGSTGTPLRVDDVGHRHRASRS